MTTGELVSLVLRVTMEAAVVAAFAFWGYHTGNSAGTRVALMIGAPVVAFGFWGAVDFRGAGRHAELLRLSQELAVSGLAAVAWYAAGYREAGIALGALSLVYHALLYATGGRLLHQEARRSAG